MTFSDQEEGMEQNMQIWPVCFLCNLIKLISSDGDHHNHIQEAFT